jgi:broad specificity phosphatase PhoE
MKKSFISIYFVRHGETVWNAEKRLQGQLDSPLTNNAIQQIQSLLPELKKYSISQILTSPLGRATSSAQIIAEHFNMTLKVINDLKERHFGDWQGELFEKLKSKELFSFVLLRVNAIKPKGGETGLNCAKRMANYLMNQMEHQSFNHSLIMTHGEILRCFLSQLSSFTNEDNDNEPFNADTYTPYKNGRIFKVLYCPDNQSFYYT